MRNWSNWATPTCGRRRPTGWTGSPRWHWPRPGRPPSSWVWPSSPPTPGGRHCWPRAWPAWPRLLPGRFTLGLGTSSDVIVSRWNGIEFAEPYKRVRDTIRFLRSALAGEKVDHEYETFTVRGFRLARPVEHPPPIFLAALRPGMLRLAGREADGVILNWLSAEDVATVKPEIGADVPVAARIFVCPTEDADAGSGRGPADDRRLPQRRRLRRLPPVARAGIRARADVERPGRPVTGRRPWRPSPTRSSMPWSSTGRSTNAGPTSAATWPTGSTSR